VPLCFIALVAPHLRTAPTIGAALVAGYAVIALSALPMKLNLIVAGTIGSSRARWPTSRESDGRDAEAVGGHRDRGRAQLCVAPVVHRDLRAQARAGCCSSGPSATCRPRC
jgi:hypothetical protein